MTLKETQQLALDALNFIKGFSDNEYMVVGGNENVNVEEKILELSLMLTSDEEINKQIEEERKVFLDSCSSLCFLMQTKIIRELEKKGISEFLVKEVDCKDINSICAGFGYTVTRVLNDGTFFSTSNGKREDEKNEDELTSLCPDSLRELLDMISES